MEGTALGSISLGTKIATAQQVTEAISGIANAMHFIGVSTTDPATAATVAGVDKFVAGDVVLFGDKEFVYDGNKWIELGDESSYVIKQDGYGLLSNEDKAKYDALVTAADGYGDIVTHDVSEFDAAGEAAKVLGTAADGVDAKTVYGAIALAGTKVDAEAGKSLVADTEIAKIHEHSNKAELDRIATGDKAKWDAKVGAVETGSANGTIAVDGTDVAVKGLGTAAYEAKDAFDAAGEAAKVLGTAADAATVNTVYGAKAAAKAAQDDIDAIVTAVGKISFTKTDDTTVNDIAQALVDLIAAIKG